MISLKLVEEKEHRIKIKNYTTSFQKCRIRMCLPILPLQALLKYSVITSEDGHQHKNYSNICNEPAAGYMTVHCAGVVFIKLGGFLQSSSATHFKTYPIYYLFQSARHKECSWLMNSLTKLVNFINRARLAHKWKTELYRSIKEVKCENSGV